MNLALAPHRRGIARVRKVSRTTRHLFLVILLALALRLAWWAYAQPIPISDFREYLELAKDLLRYGQYGYPEPTAYRLPFFPVTLALILGATRTEAVLSIYTVMLSTAVCFLVYCVVLRLTASSKKALVASALCAVSPQFILHSPVLASEHLLAVLVLAAYLFATSPTKSPVVRTVGTGLLVGLAVLTRGDGLIYGAGVLVAGLWAMEWRDHDDKRRLLQRLSIRTAGFVAAVAVLVAPWVVRNHFVMHETSLGGNGGQVFWYAHNPQGYGFVPLSETPMSGLPEREVQSTAWALAIEYIRNNPDSLIQSALDGTYQLLSPSLQEYGVFWSTRAPDRQVRPDLSHAYGPLRAISITGAWFFLLIPALALLNLRAVGARLAGFSLFFLLLNWVFYAAIFLGHPRYRYFVDIFLAMLAAGVIRAIVDSPPESRSHRTKKAGDGYAT